MSNDATSTPRLPRAFLVQDNPKLDFLPLREHAVWPPLIVFGAGQVTLEPQYALQHAREVLKDLAPRDFLVLSGDPVMIGICMAVVSDYFGRVRVLRWDRFEMTYVPIVLDFCDDDEGAAKGERSDRSSNDRKQQQHRRNERPQALELAEDTGEPD